MTVTNPDFSSFTAALNALQSGITDLQSRIIALAGGISSGGNVTIDAATLKPITDSIAALGTQITALNAKVVDGTTIMARFDAIDKAIAAANTAIAAVPGQIAQHVGFKSV